MKVNLLLLALAALLSYSIAAPICIGYKEFPDLNANCRARADEISCMQGYALRSANLSVSCVWHQLADAKTIDRQIVYNRAGSVIVSGINYQGTVCSTTMKVTLPSSAKSRWGSYIRLLSGPQNTSVYIDSTSPREAFVSSSCTIGKGAADSCTLKNTAPKGKALTPAFRENSAVLEFFTTDKALIEQWSANQRLYYNSTLKFKLEIEGTRCRDPNKYPKETPALLDEVAFGPTSYMLNENPKHYFLRSYRAYRVSNVSGINWSVNVTKSMHRSGNKTRLTSMLMRESDYFTWADQCTTNCKPPENLALPKTVCKGLYCARKIRGLGPIKEIWPRVWSLQPVLQRQEEQEVKDEGIWTDSEAPAPDADEAVALEDQGAGEARSYMPDDTPLFKPPVALPWNSEV
ncbi:hypothetical protein Ndes2437B_g00137 [Nannochloris sp. 'desiccata']